VLQQLNLPLKRNNVDKGKNPYGNRLLNSCRGNDLFIVNERIGDNKEGNLTCRNASVVDYTIINKWHKSEVQVLMKSWFISSGLILLSFSERSLKLLTFMLSMNSWAFNEFPICSSEFLKNIVNMSILDFSRLFSDVHSPFRVSINPSQPIREIPPT
jgi:hypothetical protein